MVIPKIYIHPSATTKRKVGRLPGRCSPPKRAVEPQIKWPHWGRRFVVRSCWDFLEIGYPSDLQQTNLARNHWDYCFRVRGLAWWFPEAQVTPVFRFGRAGISSSSLISWKVYQARSRVEGPCIDNKGSKIQNTNVAAWPHCSILGYMTLIHPEGLGTAKCVAIKWMTLARSTCLYKNLCVVARFNTKPSKKQRSWYFFFYDIE